MAIFCRVNVTIGHSSMRGNARHVAAGRRTLAPVALYAAYGSNMDPEQMLLRCPHSPQRGTGWLEGWRLTFGGGTPYACPRGTVRRLRQQHGPGADAPALPALAAARHRLAGGLAADVRRRDAVRLPPWHCTPPTAATWTRSRCSCAARTRRSEAPAGWRAGG